MSLKSWQTRAASSALSAALLVGSFCFGAMAMTTILWLKPAQLASSIASNFAALGESHHLELIMVTVTLLAGLVVFASRRCLQPLIVPTICVTLPLLICGLEFLGQWTCDAGCFGPAVESDLKACSFYDPTALRCAWVAVLVTFTVFCVLAACTLIVHFGNPAGLKPQRLQWASLTMAVVNACVQLTVVLDTALVLAIATSQGL
jgi:hypothetical protein